MTKTRVTKRTAVKRRTTAKTSKTRRPAAARPKSKGAKRPARPRGLSQAKSKGSSRAQSRGALFAPVVGAEQRDLGHVVLDVGRAGNARVKRMIYPPGFRWSVDMRPVVNTELCMHAHVGFLAHGEIHIEYADGCVVEHRAPQIVSIDPGHDGWVVGDEPVVLIEFDFEGDTVSRLGMPNAHEHK
jgi:hypothetical protein